MTLTVLQGPLVQLSVADISENIEYDADHAQTRLVLSLF